MNPRPRYDIHRTYEWNYEHAPAPLSEDACAWPGRWDYCGWPLTAPLAVAAGPLLNGRWLQYYASQGFDALTYKTVRRRAHPCYEPPNLQPVNCRTLDSDRQVLNGQPEMAGSWAISFGMPSQDPDVWQDDLKATRQTLDARKALAVSVVATAEKHWSLHEVAEDYAWCAGQAVAYGADMVELNLSCPNVTSCDGQLFRHPADVRTVVRRVQDRIRPVPLLLKLGHLTDARTIAELVEVTAADVSALVMVNCVPARVRAGDQLLFGGQSRGVGGQAIHDAAVRQIDAFREQVERTGSPVRLIGSGGVFDMEDVQRFLSAGASCVQLATAVMVDPQVALRLRRHANG